MSKLSTTATGLSRLGGDGSERRIGLTGRQRAGSALPPALQGECVSVASDVGRINVYAAGQGRPLLLIHSVNAAASAAEVRSLHDYFRQSRQVFSIELPGFGRSERSDRRYTPQVMTSFVHS